MIVKAYPLVSSLHDQNVVEETTYTFFGKLENLTGFHFVLEKDANKLYDNADLSLILVQTGGSENYFLRDLHLLKPPFLLLTYGFSNSLAAAIEILTYINNHNLNGEILHGSEEYISQRLISFMDGNTHE